MFRSGKHIGDSLVDRGLLTPEQVQRILEHVESTGLPFSDAAAALGFLRTKKPLASARSSVDFFHLSPRYFPSTTKDLLTTPSIVRHGALPLGEKMAIGFFRRRRQVNIGFLDPATASVAAIEKLVAERNSSGVTTGIRAYLVLPDQFLEILSTVYGQTRAYLEGLGESQVHPLLWAHLRSFQPSGPTHP